jgi:hypothetical protein
VVAEEGVQPADVVEDGGLPALVAGGPVQVEGLLGVVEGLRVVALLLPHLGESDVSMGLSGQVAGLAVQVYGAL